ncbi:DNA translocase SftA [Anaerolineae bacterium]|nr:DNA translocase SftA [Anaerolineae bacterium]
MAMLNPTMPGSSIRDVIADHLAEMTYRFLLNSKIIAPPKRRGDTRLWLMTDQDRAILIVDPLGIRAMSAFDQQAKRTEKNLRRLLSNRKVKVSNTGGIAIQIAYWASDNAFKSVPLDLTHQKTPQHIPIGMYEGGEMWLDLERAQAILVAGSSGMGKTSLLHGIIQALVFGGQTRLVLWGGNSGLEFWRYADKPLVKVAEGDLLPTLYALIEEMEERERLFKPFGARNLNEFNAGQVTAGKLPRIALIIDEFADAGQDDDVIKAAMQLTNRGRKVGIHPIIGTQHPSSETIPSAIKTNLITRIAFHVPTRANSRVIFDDGSAADLPAKPGRLLITRGGQIVEAQAFIVPDVKPSQPLPVSDELTTEEFELLTLALDRVGGRFVSTELEFITGKDKNRINAIAQKLQRARFLTEPQYEPGTGKRMGRQLTPKALDLIAKKRGTGVQAEEAEQAE